MKISASLLAALTMTATGTLGTGYSAWDSASAPADVISITELRRVVRALYPSVDVDHVQPKGPAAILVVLRFDANGNVTGHKLRERKTDRIRPFEMVQEEFGAIEWHQVDHCGVVPLTGANVGVRRGTVWAVWVQMRS